MTAPPGEPPPAPAMRGDGDEDVAALRLALRIGAVLLGSGAQTQDVESAVGDVAAGLGLDEVTAAVTFSTIAVSYGRPGRRPATLLQLVRNREADFSRLSTASSIATRLSHRSMTIDEAEARLAELDASTAPYRPTIVGIAPGVSAAASTVLFGGTAIDAAVTLGIALLIQPVLAAIDRTDLPSFFRTAFGALASTVAVAILAGIGLELNGGLILTGSLLRFLPGYALVSGFRDLLDQSMISGTARLAEALLLGAAVAGGTAAGLAVADTFGVHLSIVTAGATDWGLAIAALGAVVAVGAYAVRLGVPSAVVGQAAILGALAWLPYQAVVFPAGILDPMIATFAVAVGVGMAGRILARRAEAPAALWVVPAILPLLPGLQIVTAMLAETDAERLVGLIAAAGTAFVIGTGVASGDIVVATLRRVRERVIPEAIEAAAGGVDALLVGPLERITGRTVHAAPRRGEDPNQPEAGTAAASDRSA